MVALIDRILDLSAKDYENYNYKNVNLTYFSMKIDAKEFIKTLEEDNYKCIERTYTIFNKKYECLKKKICL